MKLPQLSVRDLFWLVLVCGLSVGWWVEHRRHALEWNEHWPGILDELTRREAKAIALEDWIVTRQYGWVEYPSERKIEIHDFHGGVDAYPLVADELVQRHRQDSMP